MNIKKRAIEIVVFFVIGFIFIYSYYIKPKNESQKVIWNFENYCQKNKLLKVWQSELNVIDIGNPWRYGAVHNIGFLDTNEKTYEKGSFLSNDFVNVKLFTQCYLNENLQYVMTKNIIFYCQRQDTLFYDDIEIELDSWNSGNISSVVTERAKSAYLNLCNRRKNKVVKSRYKTYQLYLNNDLLGSTNTFNYDCLFKPSNK